MTNFADFLQVPDVANIELFIANSGNDVIILGGIGDDILFGGSLNDTLLQVRTMIL